MRFLFAVAPPTFALLIAACGARTPLLIGGDDETGGCCIAPLGDGGPVPDAGPQTLIPACAPGPSPLIYLLTDSSPIELYKLDPRPAEPTFTHVATLDCPTSDVPRAFSMTADNTGNAFVLTSDFGEPAQGGLWDVSLVTGQCVPVNAYARGQHGFSVFGMAPGPRDSNGNELLYIQGAADLGSAAAFATLDTTLFRVTYIGANEPAIQRAQLTTTPNGLFALYYATPGNDDALSFDALDVASGRIVPSGDPQVGYQGTSFSVTQWQSTAYQMVTGPQFGGTTLVPLPNSVPPILAPAGVTFAAEMTSPCGSE